MVAVNELDKTAEIVEIKRHAAKINLDKLREKGVQFVKASGELSGYKIEYKALSMKDM